MHVASATTGTAGVTNTHGCWKNTVSVATVSGESGSASHPDGNGSAQATPSAANVAVTDTVTPT